MKRIRVGIVRYASVAPIIGQALGMNTAPDIRVGRGRITLVFRQMGASLWDQQKKLEYALHVAQAARSVLAADSRRLVRRRARRAIVVIFEDVVLDRGYDVASRWECVVPTTW